ncbi:UPF0172-domain-containing protein [Cylindrobasidium torrendii FP15055 ss-10]|uniref:UPF0172-domain-containing protein n=1 Tax=Cylindrobasidium torrendii FP15055 ss-10 TaxID=1314674 RepID=A0A0D7BB43_9AGAR|nr:UPF0172-domain-containing protein [Cylindrobasidium torrendii FP15055 ss-10]
MYTFSDAAYLKLFFHAAKHPHATVNGVLIGTDDAIFDAIPLLHHWTNLSPMMEIGLDLATRHAEGQGLKLVGYYEASSRLGDVVLSGVGERIAAKIGPKAVAIMIDGNELGTTGHGLIAYTSQGSSWKQSPGAINVAAELPERARTLVRDEKRQEKLGDFDDHLEDVRIDWLRNKPCLA